MSQPAAMKPTQFPELNELLLWFVSRLETILEDDLFGVYVVGSFALGAGDMSSDCDFLAVISKPVTADQEEALRRLHRGIPDLPGYWPINLEGSYPLKGDLETLERFGAQWLYVDRGHREMERSAHCNVADTRWVFFERGITLLGPEPQTYAAAVPGDMLRERMRSLIDGFMPELIKWASFDIVWTQRYSVETICRMLYTIETGEVTSKRVALEWARRELAPAWHRLIDRALRDRSLAWDAPSDPEMVALSKSFADYATQRAAARSATPPE